MLIVHCLFLSAYDEYSISVENLVNVRNKNTILVDEPTEIDPQSNEFEKISWEQSNLQYHSNEFKFRGAESLPFEISSLRTPCDFFSYFVTDTLLDELVDQTNLYAKQIKPKADFKVSVIEMKKYIGILIFMSVYNYPNVRSYWRRYGFDAIRSTMPVNRFEEIRRYIHFTDGSKIPTKEDPEYDVLFKIRPVINHFNDRFSSVPMIQRLCVDEQMCPTKMKATNIKQYMPAKPHKWGFNFFVLCDSTGFSHAFEIYTGAGDNKLIPNTPNLGAAANVVVRLSQIVPDNLNHIVYFDNVYTTLPLLVYLRSRGIYSLGTIRSNRISNSKLSKDECVKKMDRGQKEESVGVAYGCSISSVLWNDARAVRLVSTYVGTEPFFDVIDRRCKPQQIERWDKKTKQKILIDCPMIISEYNKHMGGVDLMDSLIGRYHIEMKTRKWINRIFHHLIDVAMVNAYLLYRRVRIGDKMDLASFRSTVAEALCFSKNGAVKRRGRPPKDQTPQTIPIKNTKTYFPVDEVRFDGVGHPCQKLSYSERKTCKYPNCKSRTQAYCPKCKLHLCSSSKNNCFIKFHTPQN